MQQHHVADLEVAAPALRWRRRVHRAAIATWVLAALLLVADLVSQRFFYGDFDCVLDSGVYGSLGWSWVPLGHHCSYRLDGVKFVVEPYPYTIWLQAAVGASACGYLIARLRGR